MEENNMKQMRCEMCGNTKLIKQDGMFVCQYCGAAYSVEEAKKMMIEGPVDVSGSTVKVDTSDTLRNYLIMANQAYDSGNKAEAETYCNKIIENDPNNYEAWFLKGKAAGWQSTSANVRLDQAINCFNKALETVSDDKKEELKKDIVLETSSLSSALISLVCEQYESLPDKDHANKIIDSLKMMNNMSLNLMNKCGANIKETREQSVKRIYYAVNNAWHKKIYAEYTEDTHPSKYVFQRLVERGDIALVLLDTVILMLGENNSFNSVVYSLMILIQTTLIGSASFRYSEGGYVREHMLNDYDVQNRRKLINEYHTKWNKIDSTHAIPSVETITKSTKSAHEIQQESSGATFCCVLIIVLIVFLYSVF